VLLVHKPTNWSKTNMLKLRFGL